jgi:hypothetical protein
MQPKPIADYPTTQQMEELFNAWRENGKDGIVEALRRLYPRSDHPAKTEAEKKVENEGES